MLNIWRAIRLFIWLSLLTGLIYPLFITLIAQYFISEKANGEKLSQNNKIIGFALIGQKFENSKYFWSRPSAVDYSPLPSGGSNLGPTSKLLKDQIAARKEFLVKTHELKGEYQIPPSLLCTSGSGLDPHIPPEAAYFQIDRIAKERHLDKETIANLIDKNTEGRDFGFFGRPRINVLKLNIALDKLQGEQRPHE